MSEAVFAHWEITRAKNAGQKDNPHGGQFDKWYVGLDNLEGGDNCEDAYWQRKNPSNVEVGDKVYGKLEEGEYGWRFFLEPEPDGAPGASRPSSEASSGSKGGRDLDASIALQVALKVLSPTINRAVEEGRSALPAKVMDAAGELQRFILETGQAVNQAQGIPASREVGAANPPSASPGSDSRPADEQQWSEHQLDEALNSAGATDSAERGWLILAWRAMPAKDELSGDERRAICLTSLRSQEPGIQASALKRLREHAGPVPKPDDSIPF